MSNIFHIHSLPLIFYSKKRNISICGRWEGKDSAVNWQYATMSSRERSSFRNEDAELVCRLARHEVCYYKIGYAARKESRVQQPARTVNREARNPVAKMI